MKADAARNGRPPQDSTEARAFWRAAGMIVLFNGLLLAWVLLDPAGDRVSAIVVNAAGFVGPLLVLPLCFGGLLEWMRRRGISRIDDQSAAMTGQRWAPVLLSMGILCYVLGQMGFTFYDLVLRQAPPFPSLADVGYLMEYPFFLLGILLLPARPIPVASRARVVLDGLMIMTAALTFSWYFILGPVIQQGTETVLAKAVSAAYPLADIVLIACLVILALRPGEHVLRRAVYVLALALGFYVVMDSIYAYQTLNETYVTGTIFDVGWPVAYMLIGLGAFAVRLAPAAAPPDETPPAREVGGDFYDFFELEDGRVALVVGDATGKGMPAALVVAATCSMLRAVAQDSGYSPGEVLAQVNEVLLARIPPNMFITCFYAILDPKSGSLSYANAGHNLPCCCHDEHAAIELSARGMPLGLMSQMSYEENEVALVAGESVLFYTDGLVEAHNSQGEMFGTPRHRDLLSEHLMDATDLSVTLMEELERFTGEDWEQEDDITLVTLERSEEL